MHVVTDNACDSVVLVWDDRQGPAFSKTFLFIAARLVLVGSHHLGSMLVNGYGAAPGECKNRGVDETGNNAQGARRGERDRDCGGGARRGWGWGLASSSYRASERIPRWRELRKDRQRKLAGLG